LYEEKSLTNSFAETRLTLDNERQELHLQVHKANIVSVHPAYYEKRGIIWYITELLFENGVVLDSTNHQVSGPLQLIQSARWWDDIKVHFSG